MARSSTPSWSGPSATPRSTSTPRSRPRPARPVRHLQEAGQARRAGPSPGPPAPAPGAIEAVFRLLGEPPGPGLPRAREDPPRPGHRRQRAGHGVRQPDDESGTGVGFTRNAATGEDKPYGDFLVNAQGEDVVAGIRNTENLDDLGKHFPGVKDELLGIFSRLEAHYRDMCDTEFTIEQGKLWMLQTRVGKRTGRAALRMAVDMTNQRRRGWKIPGRGAAAHHRGPRRAGPPPPVRVERHAGHRHRPGGLAGRGRARPTSPPTRAAEAAAAGAKVILVRTETSPRTSTACRRPRASSPPGAGWSATPPWWPAGWGIPAVVGAEGVRDLGDVVHGGGRHGGRRATSSRSTAPPARWCWARPSWPSDPRPSWTRCSAGPTPSATAGARWACGPTPTPARRQPRPASWAPRASACAAPSTCSWARTACRSCGR